MARDRTLTNAEFDQQYKAAGMEPAEPLALEARYRTDLGLVWIKLSNECVFAFPPHLVEALADAPERTIADVEVLPGGCGLHWENLDLDLSMTGLLMGSFGTRTWMQEIGRKGGQSTSEAKAEAARRNGRKGGRPARSARDDAKGPADRHPHELAPGYLWQSNEPPKAKGVVWPVVAGEEGSTTPGSRTTPRSSRTPTSRTPGQKAA